MKLWQRQTFWALMVILLSISLTLALFVRREAGRQLQNAMTEASSAFLPFYPICRPLSVRAVRSLAWTAPVGP